MILSLSTYIFIFWLIAKMINSNVQEVISLLPVYQERLQDLYTQFINHFNIKTNFDAKKIFQKNRFK